MLWVSEPLELLRQSLREVGYVEGQNLAVEWRDAEGKPERFGDLAAEHVRLKCSLPAISGGSKGFVDAGGLMYYWANQADLYQRVANYVDRIHKGAKPSDLPIEQPTRFELVINLKTAKALGLTIPPSLLGRANEVIQ